MTLTVPELQKRRRLIQIFSGSDPAIENKMMTVHDKEGRYVEFWKPIREQPIYSISSHGRVRNEKTGRELRPAANGRSGQLAVRLGSRGDAQDYYIHRLVAEHFKDDFDSGLQYVHANGDVNDNRPENLVAKQWSAAPRRGGRSRR